MRWSWLLTLPVLWAASPTLQDVPQQAQPRLVRPALAITGARSAIEQPTYQRLRSAQELARTWLLHLGEPEPKGDYGFFYNTAGVPEVDFEAYEVVAIFGGRMTNSAGFKVLSVAEEKDRRVVRFDHKSYQTAGAKGGGKQASPFGFFLLSRSELPVVLEQNVQSLIGEPPVWKERARL